MNKLYLKVAALLAAITAVSVVVTMFTASVRTSDGRLRVVTSFYPVYIAALNLTDGVSDVETVNMVGAQTGCLHDYQMSPDNRMVLDSADILCVNGAGAEAFLEDALAQLPDLPVIDLSAGIELLPEGDEHHHHEEEADTDEHEHEHEHEEGNEHLWTSPPLYRAQVENLCNGLCALDPAHAQAYRENAAVYLNKIDAVWTELQQAAAALPYQNAVLFSESLAYLARDLKLNTVAQLAVGEESGVSANELAQAEQALRQADNALLLYDSQYMDLRYTYLESAAAHSAAVTLDMAVRGASDKDAWLDAMTHNVTALREVAA